MTPTRQVVLTGAFTTALIALVIYAAYSIWRARTVSRAPWLASFI